MRRDLVVIILIAGAALGIRIYPAWQGVFGGPRVNFLETDAWYHVRLVENQVANFPSRVTVDPYAAPGGQFVPIAPLYDVLTAAAVVAVHGRGADSEAVARVAAYVPPVLGALSVMIGGLLAMRLFGPRAGWLAAALLAVLPGHFLDRTMLGFVDHHALEALLALVTLLAVVVAIAGSHESDATATSASRASGWLVRDCLVGVALGLYLLSWASGALLVAILGVWLFAVIALSRSAAEMTRCARALGTAAIVALGMILTFQDSQMHRFATQVIGLIGLTGMAVAIATAVRVSTRRPGRERDELRARQLALATLTVAALAGVAILWLLRPDAVSQVLTDAARLAPDPARTGVLEARPLFSYPGEFNWRQPWEFFRSGFYIGLVALLTMAVRLWRDRRVDELLLWVFTAAMFVATIGQNRFGYYLIPACALVGGWLADRALAWGETTVVPSSDWRAHAIRLLPTVAVAGLMFAPALPKGLIFQPRSGMFMPYWQEALDWIAQNTPEPFGTSGLDDRFYLTRYHQPLPAPDYTIMNWWDQGYYLVQRAHRVPVSNPTQERAGQAARFYTETDEGRALEMLGGERARYVLADWELPFRLTPEGRIAGRFQTLGDWAGIRHADHYQVCYRRTASDWTAVWIFYEPYYRSMAYRLSVLGGVAATPSNATSVVTLTERHEANGQAFCELVAERTFATYDAARELVDATRAGELTIRLAGLDPWQAAFPIPALTSLREVHAVRTVDQQPTEGPWVRIFTVQ